MRGESCNSLCVLFGGNSPIIPSSKMCLVLLPSIANNCNHSLLISMSFLKRITILGLASLIVSLAVFTLQPVQPSPQGGTSRQLVTSYTTTAARTASVSSYCSGLVRSALVDSSQSSANSFFKSQLASLLPIDGNALMKKVLGGDMSGAQTSLQSSMTQVAAFIGPFILGLVLLVLLAPFLCCCCTCPQCCPVRCCRKPEDEQYSKCELYWPTVTLILALLLCIGACIAGFSQSQLVTSSLDSTSCSVAIILDDILNGNVTSDGSSFFVGLHQLSSQLGYLDGNLTSINNTMANLKSSSANMSDASTKAATALSDIAKIPNNVNAGGNMAAIAYQTPLNSASPSSTINSIFPAILGSSTTGGYVGDAYSVVSTAKTMLDNIATSADNFISETSNFQSGVTALKTTIDDFATTLTKTDNSTASYLDTAASKKPLINLGVQLVYGVTVGLACLMLVGTLLMAFCDKTRCRYLVYFSCFLLFWIGLAGFLLSGLFSVLTPAVYFGCQFIDFSLASSSNFDANFETIISDPKYRSYLTSCLPSSSGDLISSLGGSSVHAIGNLSSSLTGIGAFNITYQASVILSAMTQVTSYIANYRDSVIPDIDDPSSMAIMANISKPSNYASCTATGFASDSWIPSNSQNPVYIDCQIPGGSLATGSVCSSGSNFASRGSTCKGCMDITSVLPTSTYANKAAVLSALGSRYSGCTTFNNDLANLWNNYYLPRTNAYAPVNSRAATATTSVNTLTSTLTGKINTTLTNAVTALNSAAGSVTDPVYGLMAGLNCRLIGEDIQRASSTICLSILNISYFSRLVLGLASFGILFAMCCGVCTGVRFYKHSIRKLNSADNTGLSDDQVEDITNTNFVKPKHLE